MKLLVLGGTRFLGRHAVDDATLLAAGIVPWMGLPLWIPASDAAAGFLEFDCRRAHRAGLVERPLAATIDDTAVWLLERDNAGAWQHALTAAQERALAPAGTTAAMRS